MASKRIPVTLLVKPELYEKIKMIASAKSKSNISDEVEQALNTHVDSYWSIVRKKVDILEGDKNETETCKKAQDSDVYSDVGI